ncbi:phosphonate ABC transporter, permease protein PhnE [Alkalispirochaeta alkalica]|uniref:phosphonate ABC transporter, permease protein PhnE n=1 Tax=Alkalispirochaeta alkalica TaxID=46356 RepID=UPI0003715483|nr:phosphonate ABC transporter, permease protein PhnE [Alkalispirochaeta alkalica]
MSDATTRYRWRRPHFIENPWVRYTVLLVTVLYLIFALQMMQVSWQRVLDGIPRAGNMLRMAFPPDYGSRGRLIVRGFIESFQMTVIATAAGVLLSVPIGFMAAKNIAPLPVYLVGRAIVVVSRSLHPVVMGVLFVAAVGFGAFAGILTLIMFTIGFVGKLLAEAIEEIKFGQVEGVRSTGAGFLSVLVYAVFPQVLPRLIGLSMYQLDINLRASAIVGLVGAGGIGGTLNTAFGRYDYATAAAILLVMVAIILVTEGISGYLRRLTK